MSILPAGLITNLHRPQTYRASPFPGDQRIIDEGGLRSVCKEAVGDRS